MFNITETEYQQMNEGTVIDERNGACKLNVLTYKQLGHGPRLKHWKGKMNCGEIEVREGIDEDKYTGSLMKSDINKGHDIKDKSVKAVAIEYEAYARPFIIDYYWEDKGLGTTIGDLQFLRIYQLQLAAANNKTPEYVANAAVSMRLGDGKVEWNERTQGKLYPQNLNARFYGVGYYVGRVR